MTQWVYIDESYAALARRWLHDHAGGPVRLLAWPKGLKCAEALRDGNARITEVATLSETFHHAAPGGDGTEIVLPIALDTIPTRAIDGCSIPDWTPYYPLFRELWKRGFRRFLCYSLTGTLEVRVPHLLDEFAGRHKGRRAFVIGNGPSLNEIDMGRLKDEITFGSNRVYLGFEQWGFTTTYWGISDWLQIEEYGAEYEEHVPCSVPAFYPFDYLAYLRFANGCPTPFVPSRRPFFAKDCGRVYIGHSVTYCLMQIAAIMGCNPIILVGVDHDYPLRPRPWLQRAVARTREAVVRPLRGTALYEALRKFKQVRAKNRGVPKQSPVKQWRPEDAVAPTHFTAEYAAGERKFMLPEPAEMDRDFRCAARWARENGMDILNATPGSNLEIFARARFEDLF